MPRQIDPEKALFTIGAVADILGIKPRMLRVYEDRGLIYPTRSGANRRLYSLNDIDVLAYIQYLTCVKKVNIAGVLEILDILKKLDEKTRASLMAEIEEQIQTLPQDKRKAFQGDEEELADEIIRDMETIEESKKSAEQRNK